MTDVTQGTGAQLGGLGARWAPVPLARLPAPRPQVVAAKAELSEAVAGRLSWADFDRLSYARDNFPLGQLWQRKGQLPPPPDAVAWPSNEAEVVKLVRVARARRVPLIPFGAGSGVCGGTWAIHGGVTVDLKRLDAVGPVDAAQRAVTVGAGVMGETLERSLNARGWTLGHAPSTRYSSTVGGWLASRSAGQLSSRYGKIEDQVLSVSAVLGTGDAITTPERPFSGPDLTPLLLGSEGTLAILTAARLRIAPIPAARVFHGFDFPSVHAGLESMRLILREGLRPALVHLADPLEGTFEGTAAPVPPAQRGLWARTVRPVILKQLARQLLGRPKAMQGPQRLFRNARLLLMFEGDATRAEAEDRAATSLCRSLGAEDRGEAPGRAFWAQRFDGSFRLAQLIDAGAFADTLELAAPWDRVQEVYERVSAAASEFAVVRCQFGHASPDGCALSFHLLGSAPDEQQLEARYHQLWRAALGAGVSTGSNVSHHHGVGLLKGRALQDSLGEGRHALAALKDLFDPDGVMNPGKLGLAP